MFKKMLSSITMRKPPLLYSTIFIVVGAACSMKTTDITLTLHFYKFLIFWLEFSRFCGHFCDTYLFAVCRTNSLWNRMEGKGTSRMWLSRQTMILSLAPPRASSPSLHTSTASVSWANTCPTRVSGMALYESTSTLPVLSGISLRVTGSTSWVSLPTFETSRCLMMNW